MKVAIIGAAGKTGSRVVRESLRRSCEVVAVCRDTSVHRLHEFTGNSRFTLITAPVLSDEATLTRALAGCDAVIAVLITVGRLKATHLVSSLAKVTATHGLERLIFTAGEATAAREEGEDYTARQRIMRAVLPLVLWFTPYSVTDMLEASELIREQPGWKWTIIRAPSLNNGQPSGYRLCNISELTSAHVLSRDDYAACLLDSVREPMHHKRTLAVSPIGR